MVDGLKTRKSWPFFLGLQTVEWGGSESGGDLNGPRSITTGFELLTYSTADMRDEASSASAMEIASFFNVDMESEKSNKEMVVEQFQGAINNNNNNGLVRQTSMNTCLCSPTTHAASFRCRLHRNNNTLQRTKSSDPPPHATCFFYCS
ncbi:hypothetical protein PIB30_030542 [Stylosanthes scabra]|uniref:Uncharacterized protein n=1 Tax=Stylosanthes scabra TaxID=79078 RepID=A0ABU6QBS2_9FABA|nr:hypothetical protein [Stylosanthes scabra]